MNGLRDIPGIPTQVKLDSELRSILLALREHVRALRGFTAASGGAGVYGTGFASGGGGTGSGTGGGGGSTTPDLTPPPTPTVVDIGAGIDFVGIKTTPPTFTQGHGYARTIVYGAKYSGTGPLPTFASAVIVHEFVGEVGSFPSDPATEWHLWLKWKTVDGVLSSAPSGGTNGHVATTGQDVSLLLDALTGEITESQLYSTLGARINLIDGPDTLTGSVAARVLAESTTRASADSALSSSITTLSSTVAGNTAAISTEATTRATETGALFAQYTVKLDVNGYVSGYGLASTSTGATPTSTFIIRSDSFAVASPSGPGITPAMPFIVRTTAGTVNGVPYPAGVYIDAAYILDLTAAVARLGSVWVTNGMIATLDASKLTAGTIAVGEYVQSSNYVAGTSGWRIHGNGIIEARDSSNTRIFDTGASGTAPVLKIGSAIEILANGSATFAGALSAATGTFSGALSAATGTFAGSLLAATGTFSGNLSAAGGTFAGTLSAATGTFSGSLSGASGTFGTITSGFLQNSAGTAYVNLGATGSSTFLSANSGAVRITADGDAYFTKSIASGTTTVSVALGTSTNTDQPFQIDTGFLIPNFAAYERSLSARITGYTVSVTSSPGGTGTFVASLRFSLPPAPGMVSFVGGVEGAGQNPYGAGNGKVFLDCNVAVVQRGGVGSITLTSVSWTLDAIA